jgi:RHS repeat-associated protein
VTGADNRLLSDGTHSYEYDGEGNLIRKTNPVTGEVTEYTWDDRNRLTDVVHRDGSGRVLWEEHYVYDVFHRRIAFRSDPDGAGPQPESLTFVLHDLQQPSTAGQVAQGGLAPYVDGIYGSPLFAANPVADFTDPDTSDGITPSLSERRLYAAAVDLLLAREDLVGHVLFNLGDYQGSVRTWVKPDGTIESSRSFDGFGNLTGQTAQNSTDRFMYTARERDAQLGIYYYRARYYDPAAGRFLSGDVFGFGGGDSHVYRYVFNQPTRFADPTGALIFTPAVLWGAAKVIGAIGAGIGLGIGAGAAYTAYEAWSATGNPFDPDVWGGFVSSLAGRFDKPDVYTPGRDCEPGAHRVVVQTFIPKESTGLYLPLPVPPWGLWFSGDFRAEPDVTPGVADNDYRTRIDITIGPLGEWYTIRDAGRTRAWFWWQVTSAAGEAQEGREMFHDVAITGNPALGYRVDVTLNAGDPLTMLHPPGWALTPRINAEFTINIGPTGLQGVSGQHDGFPAYEVWVQYPDCTWVLAYWFTPVVTRNWLAGLLLNQTFWSLYWPMEWEVP